MEDKKIGLSLCLIVGPGEDKELKRCLESCKGDLFDEIVITISAPEMDEKVKAVAQEYTDNITFFKWCNDFSAARNFNFSQAQCAHIAWLDADDQIKPESYQKLKILKNNLKDVDMVLLSYVYAHDEKDNPVVILPRERIVINDPKKISWHDPIHEYLNMDGSLRIKKEDDIFIDHYRTKPFDPRRNLDLLELEYSKPDCSARIKFYYGKELADINDWDKAVPVLENCLNSGEGFPDNLSIAAIKLSRYYFSKKEYDSAKATALKGIKFSDCYAENQVLLGDVSWEQGDKDNAIRYFKEAMTKKFGAAGMSQIVEYYKFIPSWRLASIYLNLRDFDNALKYCDKALECKPDSAELKEMRNIIVKNAKVSQGSIVLTDNFKKAFEELASTLHLKFELEDNNIDYARIKLQKNNTLGVAWLVLGLNMEDPSFRIRRYNISNSLRKLNIDSAVVPNYRGVSIYDIRNVVGEAKVLVFSCFGQEELELIKYFKGLGKKIIYDFNEAIFGIPYQKEIFNECDAIVCCSTVLGELTAQNGYSRIAIIRDAVENLVSKPLAVYKDRYDKPKALYIGMGGNSFLVTEYLRDTINKAGYDLEVITEWDNATKKWCLATYPKDMVQADVVLCPQRVDVQPAKSNVKVTTAMDLGLPVIASPIRSYEEVIEHGVNGFLCNKQEEWYDALIKLKDPKVREKIGLAGMETAKKYSAETMAKEWCKLFDIVFNKADKTEGSKVEASKEVVERSRDIVDVIITSYNNVEYLKLCVSSIMMNTLHPFHLIISDSGSGEETWSYLRTLKGITILGKQGVRKTFSEACNDGIAQSNSKYFVILNSDLIMSKCWLTALVEKMNSVDRLAACGVLSNCDRGWLNNVPGRPTYPMRLDKAGIELVPAMKYDQIKPHIDELYDFMQESNKTYKGKFVPQEWVACYCTIYARSAIEEVGYFDTRFKNGCEDLDLCMRLNKSGYVIGQAIDSFVFHFGGISRQAFQEEGKESYNKEDVANHLLLKEKWKKEKVFLYCGPGWEKWNKKKVDEGMAGSETWATYLGEALTRKGYEVTIYNDLLIDDKNKYLLEPVEGSDLSVIYRDYTKLEEDLKYIYVDYFISSRTTDPFNFKIHTHNRFVIVHDVFLSPDPNYDVKAWMIKKYAYLSDWHKEFLLQHHKQIPADKMFLTANGENFDNYKDVDSYIKKNQAVYSSSPDRGLYELLTVLPQIRKEVPDFELIVAYGFYNWEEMCKYRKDERELQEIAKIKKAMDQPGVKYVGRLDKKTLANYQKESKVWLYFTWFSETFSITALTAGLAKTAIVTSKYAGLITTVGDSGILIEGDSKSKEYLDKATEETIKLLKDEEYRKVWAEKGWKKMQMYSWDKIADGWIKEFKSK
jgi:glycosyltransferase involved in cell wall biosynthesis/predicted negative regulator of RcsB-dependent stress response